MRNKLNFNRLFAQKIKQFKPFYILPKALINSSFFFLLFFLYSCSESQQQFCIPKEEMIDILVDIHIADGVLNTETFSYEDSVLRAENYYKNVFRKHHIDRYLFDSALTQYTQNRTLYIEMYDEVIEKLRTEESYIQIENNDTINSTAKGELFNFNIRKTYDNPILAIHKLASKAINSDKAKSGKYSYKVDKQLYVEKHTRLLKQPLEEVEFQLTCDILFEKIPAKMPQIVFALEKDKKVLTEQKVEVKSFIKKADIWSRINVTIKLSLKTPEDLIEIKTYILNRERSSFYLDNYALKIKQTK